MRRLSEQINRKKSVIVSYYGSKAELMAEIVADILLGFEHDQNPSAACMLEPQQMALAFGAPYPLACEECVNKNYRALFREQYSQQALRNSFTSAFIREYDQVQRVFEELAGQRKQPAGDYRAAAVVFVHGMCSLTIGQTVSAQEQFLKLEERRLHIAAILVSYLLYGLAQPWT